MCRMTPKDRRKALLSGFGLIDGRTRRNSALTRAQRLGRLSEDLKAIGDLSENPQSGQIAVGFADGEALHAMPFSFDMLRRAAAIADGNAFFGVYDPMIARCYDHRDARFGRRYAEAGEGANRDLSLGYGEHAARAVAVLEGLNIDVDDLIAAAFLGAASDGLQAGDRRPSHAQAIDAIVQIVLRLAANKGALDAEAIANLERIEQGLRNARRLIEKGEETTATAES